MKRTVTPVPPPSSPHTEDTCDAARRQHFASQQWEEDQGPFQPETVEPRDLHPVPSPVDVVATTTTPTVPAQTSRELRVRERLLEADRIAAPLFRQQLVEGALHDMGLTHEEPSGEDWPTDGDGEPQLVLVVLLLPL